MEKTKRCLVIVATVVALFLFGNVLVHALWYSDSDSENGIPILAYVSSAISGDSDVSKTADEKDISTSKNPISLVIPSLDIDAKIQKVGISKKGNMATPNNFTDVGWYKYGAAPGEPGNAVMAGHVDNGLRFPGVFKHLEDLKKGDEVYVKMEDGQSLHYVVSGSMTYDYDAKVPAIFSEKGTPHLKLITCTGNWMPTKRTHDKRLVVTADLVK